MGVIRKILKMVVLFLLGGFTYYRAEIILRGYSHWSMLVVGGLSAVLIGLVNEVIPWKMPFYQQCIIASLIITTMEFVSGLILKMFGIEVWDYSDMPFNFIGIICLPFSLLWTLVGGFTIIWDDFWRWLFFKEKFPEYKMF
jgi:uncharacterized membrane protein